MRSSYYRTRGLRTQFPKGTDSPGPVTVMRPNGDGVLAPVPAEALEARLERALPSHAELNAVRFGDAK